MADSLSDGRTRVHWVTTISNINSPTAAEINAGVNLTSFLTPDGLVGFEPETADVDVSALDSVFDTKVAGRASFSGTLLRLKKNAAADNPSADTRYDLFVRDLAGYVVIRRDLPAGTAVSAAQKVEVYPSVTGETRNIAPESNTVHRYEVPVKVSSTPQIRATVV
jgi:hypothetical protein